MACESLLGLEDAMDKFLQSVDLFNDMDIDELDFASKASELLENSDSDSGISVTGEKQSKQEINVPLSDTVSGCTLTNVVGVARNNVSSNLHTSNKYSLDQVNGLSESVSVKIPISNSASAKFKRVIINPVGEKTFYFQNVNPIVGCSLRVPAVQQSLNHSGVPVKVVPSGIHSPFDSPNLSPGVSLNSPFKRNVDYCSLDELLSGTNGVTEVYEHCGNSVPSDPSLRQHLKNISSTSYPDSVFTGNAQFSPTSFLDMQELSGPSESIITHTNLERIRKKQERMMKNRQAACLSRLRKKEYLERLEMKFEQLKRENLSLWRQNEEWRTRCFRLERCIEDLQLQLPNSINSENLIVKSQSFEASSSKLSTLPLQLNKQITPHESCSKTVSVRTLTPLNEVTVGSKSTTTPSRLPKLSDLGKSNTVSIQHLKNFKNVNTTPKTTYITSMNSPKTFKWDSSSKRLLLTSKVDVESHSQSTPNQSQLPKPISKTLTTAQRTIPTVSHRSKVIATTSLLVMCGLLAMNIVPFSDLSSGLGPVSSRHMSYDGSSHTSGKLAFGYSSFWQSAPYSPTGRRLLLNIPSTQEEDILKNDELLRNASHNEFLFSEKFSINRSANNCGPNKNMSCSENSLLANARQIFQSWIERHAVSTSNQSSVYRLQLSSSLHNVKTFEQHVVSISKPSRQNLRRTQKPTSLPIQHLNTSSPKSISSARKESLERFFSSKVNHPTLNATDKSLSPKSPPPHRNSMLKNNYDLQPYIHPTVHVFEKLFNVVKRRNDTAYIVFFNRDHFLLPSIDPLPASMKQKITFLLPAHPVINGSSVDGKDNNDDSSEFILSMLQLDCEVMNATLLQSPVHNSYVKHTPDNQ
ncbi:unnamed protein product [Schistosoma turkestanicum]|nr:unnamed protein product [Schistosoma turkestanicum]